MIGSAAPDLSGAVGTLATPHHLATRAGQRAYEAGGTAIDAAIAAATVLTVVYPHMSAIGGDVQAVMALPGESPIAVNGSGAAAAAATAESLRGEHAAMPLFGVHPISVPGMVSAWQAMHARAGRLPWSALFADAIELARDGAPVAPALARDITALADRISQDPGIRSVFFEPDGRPLAEGALLAQPQLAATLQAIAAGGAAALYGGDVGRRLIAGLRRLGSVLTVEDLVAHQTTFEPVLSYRFRGVEVVTSPANTQGFVLLQILKALEQGGLDGDPLGDDAATLARLFALTALDRENYLADPRFVEVDTGRLLSNAHIDQLLRTARDLAAPIPLPPGQRPDGDTVAIAAMDREGHAITLIQSVFYAFGSGVLEPDTGILCHNRGAAFSLDAKMPSLLVGGRRPPSTLTPALLSGPDGVVTAIGTMGGKSQPQILAQHLVRLLAGVEPQASFDAPRWVVGHFGVSGSEAVLLEDSVDAKVRSVMATAGLPVVIGAHRDDRVGHSQMVTKRGDRLVAATDPRGDGRPR